MLIRAVFVQDSVEVAHADWGTAADQLRGRFPKLTELIDEAGAGVLAFPGLPLTHWTQTYRFNPLERLNVEIKRRAMWRVLSPTMRPSNAW
ncbi:MAG: transposase [Betaproteobacteria bacterium]